MSAPLVETLIDIGITGNGENSAPLMERCNLEQVTVQSGTLNGATAVAPNTPYKPPYKPPPQNARNAERESPDHKPVVVVNDLIFPPQTHQAERDSIQAALVSSGVGEEFWQQLVDELFGARMHREISNPVGYIRGMAERAMSGTFSPERGIGVARKREEAATMARQDEAQKKVFLKNQLPSEAVLSRLPTRTSAFLEKMTGGKAK